MGLNDVYHGVSNHILTMDPMPSVNKAFYLVQQVEKQRQVSSMFSSDQKMLAFNRKGKKLTMERKKFESRLICCHRKADGHSIEFFFQLIVYSEWLKGKKVFKRKQAPISANNVNTTLTDDVSRNRNLCATPFDQLNEVNVTGDRKQFINVDPHMLQAMCLEMMKIMKNESSRGIETSTSCLCGDCLVRTNNFLF